MSDRAALERAMEESIEQVVYRIRYGKEVHPIEVPSGE